MKQTLFFILAMLLVFVLPWSNGFTLNYTQMGLPEGAITRLGKGYINDIAYAPNGTQLAVATSIGVWLYDTSTDTELNLLSEGPNYVQAIAFSPDGGILASGGYLRNGVIRLWDTTTGKLYDTIDVSEEVLTLAFSPDGTILASSGEWPDYPIRLSDIATRQLRDTRFDNTGSPYALSFSPDGKTLVSGGRDNTVRLWDVQTGELKNRLKGHRDDVNAVIFSQDGEMLASGSDDGTVRLWNVQTGETFATLKGNTKFPEGITALAFSPNGTTLASATTDQIWLWDVHTKQIIRILEGHTWHVSALAFSPDGETLASAGWDWTLRFWNAATGKLRKTFGEHTSAVNTVAFSPDGKTLASASWGLIRLWNTNGIPLQLWHARTGEHLENFRYHIDYVWTVVFSPDGKHLASSGNDSRLRLWEVHTENHVFTLRGGGDAVAFSPDGKLIASAYGGDNMISTIGLWDVHTGELLHVLSRHYAPLTCVAFSPDGKTLVSASRDSEIVLWDMATLQRRLSITTQHTEAVYAVAFSPDGSTLATGSYDQTLRLWDPQTGERKAALQYPDAVTSVAFSPDGRTLAVTSGEWTNNHIQLLDTETLQPIETLEGHTETITALAFSSNGRTLVSSSCDGTTLLWEISGAEVPHDVNGDGRINIEDLRFVAAHLGDMEKGNAADINNDGVVNILDLVAVSRAIARSR
ncbi:MAG: dockerin type I domain-containing protein [Candidatus Poribacteria bacterium]|nr:dockerin type I domain-containing protein [Candidatus Poribacteria bacterium]